MEYSNFCKYLNVLVSNKGNNNIYIEPYIRDTILSNITEDIFNNRNIFVTELNKIVNSLKRDSNFKTIYRYCNDINPTIFKDIILEENPLNFKYNKKISNYTDFTDCLNTLVLNKGMSPFFIEPYVRDNILQFITEDKFNNRDIFVTELNKIVNSLKRDGNFKTIYRYCNEMKPNIFRNIIVKDTPFHFELTSPQVNIPIIQTNLSDPEIKKYIENKLPNLVFPPARSSAIMNEIGAFLKINELKYVFFSHGSDYPELLVYLKLNGLNDNARYVNEYSRINTNPNINYKEYVSYLQSRNLQKYYKYKIKYLNLLNKN